MNSAGCLDPMDLVRKRAHHRTQPSWLSVWRVREMNDDVPGYAYAYRHKNRIPAWR